jgi:GNAT superfamily N-acetyltransferase
MSKNTVEHTKENVISCIVKYGVCGGKRSPYVAIYHLYVHKALRGRGIATMLMDQAMVEIEEKFPGLPIKIEAKPFADIGLNNKMLKFFYSKYNIEIISNKSERPVRGMPPRDNRKRGEA